jgi:hypothetical protein
MTADIGTPYDDLPIEVRRENWGWFGDPWWSYDCYDEAGRLIEEMRKPFPAGENCLYCDEEFDETSGDSGKAMPFFAAHGAGSVLHVHKECQFREVMGPLAHLEHRCHCYGGDGNGTPGMTLRQEALEVWRRRPGASPALR